MNTNTPINSAPSHLPLSTSNLQLRYRHPAAILTVPNPTSDDSVAENSAQSEDPEIATRDAVISPSPSQVSVPSQLRRKPHLDANVNAEPRRNHKRKISTGPLLPRSPSVPTFHASDELNIRVPSAGNPSLSRAQPNPNKSPTYRKAPASHSSYGIETICGPPPSYSTQRTLSQDRVWKVDNGPRSKTAIDPNYYGQAIPELDGAADGVSLAKDHPTPGDISSPETLDTPSIATPKAEEVEDASAQMANYGINIQEDYEDRGRRLRAYGIATADASSKGSSSEDRKSEDLFLNIAKTDSARQVSAPTTEKRRSRISLPFLSTSKFSGANKTTALNSTSEFDPSLLSPQTEYTPAPFYEKRASLGQRTITSIPTQPVHEQLRSRTQAGTSRATSIATQSVVGREETGRSHSRRLSITTNDPSGRANQRMGLTGRNSRIVSDSHALDRPRFGDHNATESSISTTAPSTVWDELDDLKSRIRKLELTGKLPSSSAAAMSSAERPRTATTAATTMSSSPKNKPAMALQSAIEGIPSNVHPLLHEALSQAKPVLSNEVYQKLQATASEALQLVALMGSDNYGGGNASTVGLGASQERHVRRRAESMCRGLTELTIAMSAESKTARSPSYRPGSRDTPSSQIPTLTARRFSNDNTSLGQPASRVQSRLEMKRTSLGRPGYDSPETTFSTPPGQLSRQLTSSAGLQRTSTLLRQRRAQGYLDGSADEDDTASSVRPVSRARTEVGGGYMRSARDRSSLSREYTSQHPMPAQLDMHSTQRTPLPPGLGANFYSRRKYGSPASVIGTQDSSPITPNESFGRISVVNRTAASTEGTPEQVSAGRTSGPRRSLGIASRIGSNMSSRLRAVRAERNNANAREQRSMQKEVVPSPQDEENAPQQDGASVSAHDE